MEEARRRMIDKKLVHVVERITTSMVFSVPDGTENIELYLVGGGGGGGFSMHSGGGGGGGGEIIHTSLDVIPGEQHQITIGLGGLTGAGTGSYTATNGENGQPTSFGSIIAQGGHGGQSAYGSYSARRGTGGSQYKKGGDGEQVVRYGWLEATPGEEGVEILGEVYGSGGGGGGRSGDGYLNPGTNGGTNAGLGSSMYLTDGSDTYAKEGYGGGGGAMNGSQIRNGGSGCVILIYDKYE